eukprot:m.111635 g.111635  ORF g.111635 m.111635 type:complete len:573 (-) comp9241_c1_seq1:353-2071(-)
MRGGITLSPSFGRRKVEKKKKKAENWERDCGNPRRKNNESGTGELLLFDNTYSNSSNSEHQFQQLQQEEGGALKRVGSLSALLKLSTSAPSLSSSSQSAFSSLQTPSASSSSSSIVFSTMFPPSKRGVSGGTRVFPTRVIVGGIAVVFFFFVLSKLFYNPPITDFYSVMVDAGSTGSRIHIFHFVSSNPTSGHMDLKSAVFHAIKPGLSSYADDPKAAAASLHPLLDLARSSVPEAVQSLTPINLKATAGLRLLGDAASTKILKEVEDLLKSYPFLYDPDDAVEIMSGQDEGLFAWMTVNYLLESISLSSSQTCVVLDLGGGSTQIAAASELELPHLVTRTVMGAKHNLYLHSFLSYGLMAGRAEVFRLEHEDYSDEVKGLKAIKIACIPHGGSFSYQYGERKFVLSGVEAYGSRFDECLERTHRTILSPFGSFIHAPKKPPISRDQPIFAMSYYFDRAKDTGILGKDAVEGAVSINQYRGIAKNVCEMNTGEIKKAYPLTSPEDIPFLCTDLCFIISLLEKGFGIEGSQNILLAQQLSYKGSKIETQWPLGASIEEIGEEYSRRASSTFFK